MDEFELEVTDLRTDTTAERLPLQDAGTDGLAATADGTLVSDERSQPIVHRQPSGRHTCVRDMPWWRSRRARRWLGGAATIGMILLVLVVTLGGTGAQQSLVTLLRLPGQEPTVTPAPGQSMFIVKHTVPWGKLLVDGRNPLDLPGQVSFTLSPGQHTLVYTAQPFPTLRCQVSVPAARSDTCPLTHLDQSDGLTLVGVERVLDLSAGLDHLPVRQWTLLVQTTQSAISTWSIPVAIAPGDHYVAADGSVATASQPLAASLSLTLNQNPNATSFMVNSKPCITFCDGPPGQHTPPDALVLWAHVTDIHWHYTTPDGLTMISTAPFTAGQGAGGPSENMVPLTVTWDGSWQVTLLTGWDPFCAMAPSTAGPSTGGFSLRQFPSPHNIGGCLLQEQLMTNSNAAGKSMYILFRFGVDLAVNDEAHVMLPWLPVASAHEQALAREVAMAADCQFWTTSGSSGCDQG